MMETLLPASRIQGSSQVGSMQLDFAIIADAAQVLPDGKFVIMGGGIEFLYAPGYPVLNPALALILRLVAEGEEATQQHTLRLELLSPDGTNLLAAGKETLLASHPRTDSPVAAPPSYTVVISLPSLVFPAEGKYRFRMVVDGQQLGKEVPLYLQTRASSQGPERVEE